MAYLGILLFLLGYYVIILYASMCKYNETA